MNNGNGNVARNMPWLFPTDLTAAVWANWCLWSLQLMHDVSRAWMTVAAGSCAGGLKATRTYYESVSKGISLPAN